MREVWLKEDSISERDEKKLIKAYARDLCHYQIAEGGLLAKDQFT